MAGMKPPPSRAPGDRTTDSVLPGDLVRALAWLRQRLDQPVRIETLAEAAGVRPRTLESHFRTFLGTTPVGWVRRTRLLNARRALLESGGGSVTEAALANGFSQMGRFAAHYRAEFGELPSETLRRVRNADPELDDEALRLTWRALPAALHVAPDGCEAALESLDRAQRARRPSDWRRRSPPGAGANARHSISARRRRPTAPAHASWRGKPKRSRPTMPWR